MGHPDEFLLQTDALKLPPHSTEAEQAVIGAILTKPEAYDEIDWLSAKDFFSERNRLVYHAIRSMLEAGEAFDVFLLIDKLKDRGEIERVGQDYIAELSTNSASAANIKRYAEIVKAKALLRGLQILANDLTEQSYDAGAIPSDLAEQAESRLNDLRHGRDDSEPLPFHCTLDATLARRNQPDSGLRTGFPDLDRKLKPLNGGDLIIIAGRPSMGKSGLAFNIAENLAHKGKSVGAWSLEMSRALIGERILGWRERLRHTDDALGELSMLQLHIDTPNVLTIGGLRLRAKRLKRRSGLDAVIVDYLGLMRGDGENRTQQIGSISRGLKGLAIELNVPVIAVAQLNRVNESRTDKRPALSDLRESGDIEQDADIVLMVYRDEYYNAATAARGTAEILIRKHRNGPTGMVRLEFVEEHARFTHYDGPDIYDNEPPPVRPRKLSGVDHKSRAAGDDS